MITWNWHRIIGKIRQNKVKYLKIKRNQDQLPLNQSTCTQISTRWLERSKIERQNLKNRRLSCTPAIFTKENSLLVGVVSLRWSTIVSMDTSKKLRGSWQEKTRSTWRTISNSLSARFISWAKSLQQRTMSTTKKPQKTSLRKMNQMPEWQIGSTDTMIGKINI